MSLTPPPTSRRTLWPAHYPVPAWMEANEQYFLPPVCNKMMHDTQLKVFYVGGPNQRKDYHLEEGEELFFMRKGDMCLKIVEGGKFRDVHIKEGEVFLLPGRIPHSPQRQSNTVGLVIERERLTTEMDGLRYFTGNNDCGNDVTPALYEKWFYCDNLGTELGPIIKGFFASQQHRTGEPIPEEIPTHPPWMPDSERRIEKPFALAAWLDEHANEIKARGCLALFDPKSYQTDVYILGQGSGARALKPSAGTEPFFWQLRGSSTVRVSGKTYHLQLDDTLLVPRGEEFWYEADNPDAMTLYIYMDPEAKKRL